MHVIQILRMYLGITQVKLAQEAGVTQADICEMERQKPYGQIEKYRRLNRYLGVPVDALIRNDCRSIPEQFFVLHPPRLFLPEPSSPEKQLGRKREEWVFQREQARLAEQYPALSRLVLPLFKLRSATPGYDILSFDDDGKPCCLEVKTSVHATNTFRITNNELAAARKLTAKGESYVVCYISGWGTEQQRAVDIPFSQLEKSHKIQPRFYFCQPKTKKETISGLAFYRQQRGLRQEDMVQLLGVPSSDLSLYETGKRGMGVDFCIRASQTLGVTIDQLLQEYPLRLMEEEF